MAEEKMEKTREESDKKEDSWGKKRNQKMRRKKSKDFRDA